MILLAGVISTVFVCLIILGKCFSANKSIRNNYLLLGLVYLGGSWFVYSNPHPAQNVLIGGFLLFNIIAFLLWLLGDLDHMIAPNHDRKEK